ncbi:MAG: DUF2460 domain-containing protein [Sulfuriferula sp.]
MAEFLEERMPTGVRMGASYADEYKVEITTTANGNENRKLIHPFPARTFVVQFTETSADMYSLILALYNRAYGMYAGFRVQAKDDWSTNVINGVQGSPTAQDQPLALVSAGVYQLQKFYGTGSPSISIGYPVRTLFKPVAGTTRIAIGTLELTSGWTVDTTTGKVAFAANKTRAITGISQAAQAVIGVGSHTFVVGDSAYISDVSGMTQINGLRGMITAIGATTITVNINSTAFTAWTSGGVTNTTPQIGEIVKGGCQFDIPCRFNSKIDVSNTSPNWRDSGTIDIIELLNP